VSETIDAAKGPEPRDPKAERESLPARLALFYRQVIAELRKVIWPTRKELITYTAVVLVFVVVVAAYVGVLDVIFAKGVLIVFGS
jgi:preprotein translocase subunit SecE